MNQSEPGDVSEGERKVGSKFAGGIAIAPGQEKALLRSLLDAEGLIRHDKEQETVVVFDSEGKGVFVKRVLGDSVGLKEAITEYPEVFRGSTLTHNHPRSKSFSLADVLTACFGEFALFRAVGSDFDYSMSPKQGNFLPSDIEPLQTLYNEFFARVRDSLLSRPIETPKIDLEMLDATVRHEVWSEVAEAMKWVYTRVERPKKGVRKNDR